MSDACSIPVLKNIPSGSILIIGHAYGNPFNENQWLASSIENFIIKNKHLFNSIIFTGDVFNTPSREKWRRLLKLESRQRSIFIAPWNHDVGFGDNTKNDIFYEELGDKAVYPFLIQTDKTNFVLDDSGSQNWQISDATIVKLNSGSEKKYSIILRHHVPVEELLEFANSSEGLTETLPNIQDLSQKLGSSKNITIISGDTGARYDLPRLVCRKFKNLTFILNGLGETIGDRVLIVHEGTIYSVEINP